MPFPALFETAFAWQAGNITYITELYDDLPELMQSCKLLSERNMTQSQFPFDEEARLKALDELALMDTLPEPVFDEIVQRVAKACDTPIALLSLVDSRRQWFKARLGFALPELPRTIGFDGRTLLQPEPFVGPNAQEDSLFAKDPLVQSELNIRFYAGVPIKTSAGLPLGRRARRMASLRGTWA